MVFRYIRWYRTITCSFCANLKEDDTGFPPDGHRMQRLEKGRS